LASTQYRLGNWMIKKGVLSCRSNMIFLHFHCCHGSSVAQTKTHTQTRSTCLSYSKNRDVLTVSSDQFHRDLHASVSEFM